MPPIHGNSTSTVSWWFASGFRGVPCDSRKFSGTRYHTFIESGDWQQLGTSPVPSAPVNSVKFGPGCRRFGKEWPKMPRRIFVAGISFLKFTKPALTSHTIVIAIHQILGIKRTWPGKLELGKWCGLPLQRRNPTLRFWRYCALWVSLHFTWASANTCHYDISGWWFQLGWLFPYIMENKKCSKPPTSICLVGQSAWFP